MSSVLTPIRLRCEYHHNPTVDVARPRLSWIIDSPGPAVRGLRQTAWQVLVASTPEILSRDHGDLWDSARREGRETTGIEYAGTPLAPHQTCHWKVRVWDQDGKPSPWSQPAHWSAGFLKKENWTAKWIAEPERPTFEGCKWMWTKDAADEAWLWNQLLTLEGEPEVATLLIAGDCALTVFLNGELILETNGGAWKDVASVDLAPHLRIGEANTLSIRARGAMGGEKNAVAGRIIHQTRARYQRLFWIDETWSASTARPEAWPIPAPDPARKAHVVCRVGESNSMGDHVMPWGIPGTDEPILLPPPPLFRKEFNVRPGIRRARLYASALGAVDIQVDGYALPDARDRLIPGWSDYHKRVYYRCWDVSCRIKTAAERDGKTTLCLTLADGWHAGYVAWGRRRNLYNDVARVCAELFLEYEDGSTEVIATDESWRVAEGHVREADMLMGEACDMRLEQTGWTDAGFDDSAWAKACVMDWPAGIVEVHPGPPVQTQRCVDPVSIREQRPGVFIFDMGQNMVGNIRAWLGGRAGAPIRVRYAEMLCPDGELYVANLRGARCIDTFIPSHDGISKIEATFTFHGFRHVEVSGCAVAPTLDSLVGVVIHSTMEETAQFQCSHAGINKLMQNIAWGMKGNYIEVPTDCPQRDERLGWTGDAQAFIGTASCLMDIAAFMTKWLVDVEDSQHEDGAFTHVAPDTGVGGGAAGWGDAGIICPWRIYQVHGDRRILERHYGAMTRWIAYLEENSVDLIRPDEGFADWLSLNAYTSRSLIATAFFAYSTGLVARIAGVLGHDEDAARYRELHKRIVEAFQKKFLIGAGTNAILQDVGILESNTQTANTLALAFDLLPEALRPPAAFHLVRDIQIRAYHLSTGFLGLPHLLPTLTKVGRVDLAYRLLLNEDFPSWLYQIRHGATTMWERWDGWSEEFDFQNPEMNSFNHYAYGAVGEWIFQTLAGIDISQAGHHRLVFAPRPGGGIAHASASIDTIHGMASVDWRIIDGRFHLSIRVPNNTTAEIRIPCPEGRFFTGDGMSLHDHPYIHVSGWDNGVLVLDAQPGYYRFVETADSMARFSTNGP